MKGSNKSNGDYAEKKRRFERGGIKKIAAIIDVETTGLCKETDELIELAIILFAFKPKEHVFLGVVDSYTGLREPKTPISAEATRVHGLTKYDVKGKTLNRQRILKLGEQADFFVAHNASFDKGFVEKEFPELYAKDWYCSMSGVRWHEQGFQTRDLQGLLSAHNIKTLRAHRGASDAWATLRLLTKKDLNGVTYLQHLFLN